VTELIYIGGYGRSGSTLLESLLARRAGVLACGEVVSCLRKSVDRGCTCGKSRLDCEVWGAFYTGPGALEGWTHEALTLALLDRASGHYAFVVDSSKTAWDALGAPFKLRRKLGRRFHLTQLIRDPRGVCWSNAGGAWKRNALIKNPFLRHIRTSIGWWAANLSCELFGRLYPAQFQRIRYEDLVRSPSCAVEHIFSKLPSPQEPAQTPGQVQVASSRHQLFGNFARYRDLGLSEIHADTRWKTAMSPAQRAFVAAATWPLRRRYGY